MPRFLNFFDLLRINAPLRVKKKIFRTVEAGENSTLQSSGSRPPRGDLCSPLLTTARRVGFEINEGKREYLVMSRARQDDASLMVDGLVSRR